MSADLRREDFDRFMLEVTGFDPFPWQRRLLMEVLESGWPDLLDLPTGTGKTSVLLIALYALALRPEVSARRIALVVDRRIIVDQVHDFARRLDDALLDPQKPISARVATSLRRLASRDDAAPVRVVHLRGGIPRDDTWVQDPDQPTILASTVDQVGSRLLFRGYGVSPSMRPVHAGILARDTLYFLDEVHLSAAFEETLDRIKGTFETWAERGGTGRPFQVVRMSATPRGEGKGLPTRARVFALDAADRAHPVLAPRLSVSRAAILDVVKTKRSSDYSGQAGNNRRVAAHLSERAIEAHNAGAKAIGIVVNRVDTARRAAAALAKRKKGEVLLLTGRMRPFERAAIQAELTRTVAAGTIRAEGAPTTFVVATSCIEAGADLDFDALVTEVASLDALRQRFGRLNRLGKHTSSWAWIVARSDQVSRTAEEDPVYKEALRETWGYLNEIADANTVDFGLDAFKAPDTHELARLLPPAARAPVLFPNYLDMWSETRPAPFPDPDPAFWLHGKDAPQEQNVSVVFRGDIPEPELNDAKIHDTAAEALEFLPPVTDEAVSVPLRELAKWLDAPDDSPASAAEKQPGAIWRWAADGIEAIALKAMQPGDTLIIPASRGGLGRGTWDPSARTPVVDVAELATHELRGAAKLRLDPSTLPKWLCRDLPAPPKEEDPEIFESERARCIEWLRGLDKRTDGDTPAEWRSLLSVLSNDKDGYHLVVARSLTGGLIWRAALASPRRSLEATTEDAVSVFTGIAVPLDGHLRDVEAWARAFVQAAGLDALIADDVALAARLHDIGKADARFQALLHGGDAIAAATGELLAKSRQSGSRASRLRAQRRSGWPAGLRHELISLALLDASPELQRRAHDLELVRHLIASHHGWCRPWPPALLDPQPMQVCVEVDGSTATVSTAALDPDFLNACASRFRRLCRGYGWHGLAYLEALLRLADFRASAQPGARPGSDA